MYSTKVLRMSGANNQHVRLPSIENLLQQQHQQQQQQQNYTPFQTQPLPQIAIRPPPPPPITTTTTTTPPHVSPPTVAKQTTTTTKTSKNLNSTITPGGTMIATKRQRKRFEDVQRSYFCDYPDCNKGYGSLTHLNEHRVIQKHGPRKKIEDFKHIASLQNKDKKKAKKSSSSSSSAVSKKKNNNNNISTPVDTNSHPGSIASLMSTSPAPPQAAAPQWSSTSFSHQSSSPQPQPQASSFLPLTPASTTSLPGENRPPPAAMMMIPDFQSSQMPRPSSLQLPSLPPPISVPPVQKLPPVLVPPASISSVPPPVAGTAPSMLGFASSTTTTATTPGGRDSLSQYHYSTPAMIVGTSSTNTTNTTTTNNTNSPSIQGNHQYIRTIPDEGEQNKPDDQASIIQSLLSMRNK